MASVDIAEFNTKFKEAEQALKKLRDNGKKESLELEAKKQSLTEEIQKMEELRVKWGTIIKLNVGGKKYSTTKSTLCMQYEDSMLASMFSGRYELGCDDEGCVFIDRDGQLFKYVLTKQNNNKNSKHNDNNNNDDNIQQQQHQQQQNNHNNYNNNK